MGSYALRTRCKHRGVQAATKAIEVVPNIAVKIQTSTVVDTLRCSLHLLGVRINRMT
jgi:hypothetical protein